MKLYRETNPTSGSSGSLLPLSSESDTLAWFSAAPSALSTRAWSPSHKLQPTLHSHTRLCTASEVTERIGTSCMGNCADYKGGSEGRKRTRAFLTKERQYEAATRHQHHTQRRASQQQQSISLCHRPTMLAPSQCCTFGCICTYTRCCHSMRRKLRWLLQSSLLPSPLLSSPFHFAALPIL